MSEKNSKKRKTIKQNCLEVAPRVWAEHPIARPLNFAESVAEITIEEDQNYHSKSEDEKKAALEIEKKGILSSVRKALYRLVKEGKIGLHSKARYVPLDVAISNDSKNYLWEHLHPTRKELQQVTDGTYILPIVGDDVLKFPGFEIKQYDKVSDVGADLNILINFVQQMVEEKSKKVSSARLLSQHIRAFIGIEYCYDVAVLEDKIIIIMNTDKVEACEPDAVKENNIDKLGNHISKFENLVKEIYDKTYNPPKPKMKLKKITEERIS